MHELAVCQELLTQLQRVAAQHRAAEIHRVRLSIGPLSGIEPALLEQAFTIARAGTVASRAKLEIEHAGVSVRCKSCGTETRTAPNRLLCGKCGGWRVDVTAGDETMLVSVELARTASLPAAATPSHRTEQSTHV